MRREATQAGDGWGHPAPSGQRAPGPRQRAEQLLDTCLGAVADIRCGEVRLLDAVVALRSEIDHQLFGAGESTGSDTRARHRRADSDAATVDELATASGMSRLYTHGLVRFAGAAPARVARGREAVVAGQVELRRVIDWYEATDHLTEEDALAIGDSVFTPRRDGTPRSASDFRRLLSKRVKQVEAADREARRQRTEEALAQRSSWATPADDGTGSLTVTGEATRVAAAHSRLDAAARRAKAAGDERSLSQLRSDLHLDLLLVGQLPPGGRRARSRRLDRSWCRRVPMQPARAPNRRPPRRPRHRRCARAAVRSPATTSPTPLWVTLSFLPPTAPWSWGWTCWSRTPEARPTRRRAARRAAAGARRVSPEAHRVSPEARRPAAAALWAGCRGSATWIPTTCGRSRSVRVRCGSASSPTGCPGTQ
ncbi:hypothetical protein BJF82_09800 [Kytococcus sp. CUA-901]|nr:hypothetical protein BJF82_09800 [Kytococcus sp. CUA-901]